jgi:hypothetical protein
MREVPWLGANQESDRLNELGSRPVLAVLPLMATVIPRITWRDLIGEIL